MRVVLIDPSLFYTRKRRSTGSFPPSPLRGEGRGGGDLRTANSLREVIPTSRWLSSIFVTNKNRARVVLPPQGRGIAYDDGRGFGRAIARQNPPIYVLAAQAAIHDNGPRTRCKWRASPRSAIGFSLEHDRVDAFRGWPPPRPGRNLGILDRAKARSRIPARPRVVSKCDSPAPQSPQGGGDEKLRGSSCWLNRNNAVIPAQAGTHGKPEQAFSQRRNTVVAPDPIPIHTQRDAAYVGSGLRRDDGCGEAFIEIKSGTFMQVGTPTP
jgi:hypothetical protein